MAKIADNRLFERIKTDWLYYILLAFLSVVAILEFVAWKPVFFFPSTPEDLRLVRIDASTIFALTYWFEHGVQFGKDVIFAYGPLGFIKYSKYHPAIFPWMITGQIFLSLAFVAGAWALIRNSKQVFFTLAMAIFLCFLMVVFQLGAFLPWINMKYLSDAFLQSFIVLLVVNYYFVDTDSVSVPTILLLLATALVTLIKVSLLFLTIICILCITISDLFEKKRIPIILIIFSASFLALWYASGQLMLNIPDYFLSSMQLVNGYTEAMSYDAPVRANLYEIILYIVTAFILLALLFIKLKPHRTLFNLIPFLLFALFIFMIFKHSFVRHGRHALEVCFMLVFFLYIVTALRRDFFKAGISKTLFGLYIGMSIITSAVIIIHYLGPSKHRKPALAQLKQDVAIHYKIMDMVRLAKGGEQTFKESLHAEKDAFQRASGLPVINESIDVYPDNLAIVTALELKYRPRPVAISHGAYSPFLAIRDAEHLRGSNAPEKILFKVETIDWRYPSIDDGISWPELWTRYAVERSAGDYLLLSRLKAPKKYALTKTNDLDIPFEQWVNLSDRGDGLVWAEIDIKQTLIGRLVKFLYKLPEVKITVRLKDNTVKEFRIIPTMLSSGFLLSPLVEKNQQFKDVMSNNQKQVLAAAGVQAVMFSVANWWSNNSSDSIFYDKNFNMKIYRLAW